LADERRTEVAAFARGQMKRSYDETDRALPAPLFQHFPHHKQRLDAIQALESQLQSLHCVHKRKKLFLYCHDQSPASKILRIYLRHKFIAATDQENSHFLLTIEGRLLDLSLQEPSFPFGSFFDQIRIQIDKRYHTPATVAVTATGQPSTAKTNESNFVMYEWRKDQFLAGKKATCFRFKIYSDKSITPIKIAFTRSADSACKRYELSSAMRELLPHMRVDPTEDEVLTAVWQYIEFNSIYDVSSSRALLRCDEVCRLASPLLSADSVAHFLSETARCPRSRARLSLVDQVQNSRVFASLSSHHCGLHSLH
jgi:hypothetical protein